MIGVECYILRPLFKTLSVRQRCQKVQLNLKTTQPTYILSENRKQRKIHEKESAVREDEILLPEKWLVAFKNPNSKKNPESSTFVRQFYAPGFYEAYDIVATYAEKLKLDILWFKEKRNCGYAYINKNYLQLESFCTYCNNKFNHIDPIPCIKGDCQAEFCSKECMADHYKIRHRTR